MNKYKEDFDMVTRLSHLDGRERTILNYGIEEGRAKAIDEFAEKICTELTERSFEAIDASEFVLNVVSHDKMQEVVMEIAEQLKKEGAT